MAALIVVDPARASREILAAFKANGGSAEQTAEHFGVTRRQFDRWVRRLHLEEAVAEIRRKAR